MLFDVLGQDFCIIDIKSISDGQGGTIDTETNGAVFPALATMLQSQEMMIAYQNGQKRVYAIFAKETVGLRRDMKLKRLSDGARFRIITTPEQQKPPFSNIPMVRATMEVIEP